MKLRTEHFTTLLLITVILLAGCSGCAQKTDTISEDARKTKLEALDATEGLSSDEYRRQKVQILVEGRDSLAAARALMRFSFNEETRLYLDKAIDENPNDFDTLLYWTKNASTLPGESREIFDQKQIDVYRRLHKMNPVHVEVLHGLAMLIFAESPEEAIEYAEKAFELDTDPNGISFRSTVLARAYKFAGQYEKALAEYERVYKNIGDLRFNRFDLDHLAELRERVQKSKDKE